ncbi:MAG: class I SAM-dependent methyltransferase [Micromonosporaceae bacterium]
MDRSREDRGSGPGAITPDGSSVDLYSLLTAEGEPEVVRAAVGDSGSILELGCGAGRVTHALVGLGYEVVAVDESEEMLARVHGAERVCAKAETLALGRRFDCVMLTSYLVNTPDDATRAALLATCRRHVRDDGCVLIQWQPAEAHDAWERGHGRVRGDLRITMSALDRPAPNLVAATMTYEGGGRVWTQSFTSLRLTDDDLAGELARTDLVLDRFLTDDRTWICARPAPAAAPAPVSDPARRPTIG